MITFQDFENATDKSKFILSAVRAHTATEAYKTAVLADKYDRQENPTVTEAVRTIYNLQGEVVKDYTASNHRIASNIFNRLNTQRCMFSLGNGVSFIDPFEAAKGEPDTTKEMLGQGFDHVLREAAYHALIHGTSYLYWDGTRAYEFETTEFVPFDDENDGSLRAGVRFWQLDSSKPLNMTLYEKDGLTRYAEEDGKVSVVEEKRPYKVSYTYTESDGLADMDGENYPSLPVVRMYASRLKQSTLVGMKEAIDAYDLIQSGFANDLSDCAQIYWIVENYGGMDDQDLRDFLNKLKLNHVANADTQAGGKVTPYTQDIPYQARKTFLDDIKARIYEDFGGLDVHTIAAGATNDHIDAAYQPLEEEAADFEHWVGEAVVQLLSLVGVDDVPQFHRMRVSNQKEQVEMLVQEAAWLDTATIVRKLPNLTIDERQAALEGIEDQAMSVIGQGVGE